MLWDGAASQRRASTCDAPLEAPLPTGLPPIFLTPRSGAIMVRPRRVA